jgi:hypothetical protein
MPTDRDLRLAAANLLLECIATNGRRFFSAKGRIARLELARGRIFYHDPYSERRIYTHYRYRWRGFSQGGTMRALVIALREFVTKGVTLNPLIFGPWPDWYCGGDLWGYGESMANVRATAAELGITGIEKRSKDG